MSALADYTDLYNEQVPTDPAMCDLALHYMTEQPGGDHDKIARAYWTPSKPQSQASISELANKAIKAAMISTGVLMAAVAAVVLSQRRV